MAIFDLSGCYRTAIVPGHELLRFESCGPGQQCFANDDAGHRTRIDEWTDVTIVHANQREPTVRFQSIRVLDGIFVGVTTTGARIEVPVASIQQLEVKRYSGGQLFLWIAIPMGLIILGLAIGFGLAYGGLGSQKG